MGTLALWSSFILGLLDGLSPGHGKSVMATLTVSERFSAREVAMMIGSLLFTHFLLLLIVAVIVQTWFAGDDHIVWLELSGPVIVTLFGCYILWKARRKVTGIENIAAVEHKHGEDCECVSHSKLNPVPQKGMIRKATVTGMLLGLVPCPIAISTIFLSAATGQFGNLVLTVLIYVLGMAVVMTAFGVLTVRGQQRFTDRISKFSGRYNLQLMSGALITTVGVVYIIMQSMHVHVHF